MSPADGAVRSAAGRRRAAGRCGARVPQGTQVTQGTSLIEAVAAALVLAVGVLAVLSLQVRTVQLAVQERERASMRVEVRRLADSIDGGTVAERGVIEAPAARHEWSPWPQGGVLVRARSRRDSTVVEQLWTRGPTWSEAWPGEAGPGGAWP